MPDRQPFWDYSLRLYPKAEPWLLAQQQSWGANVNLLLFACFAGANGRAVSADHWQQLEAEIAGWNDLVVEPLRAVRQRLKAEPLAGDAAPVREQVKQVELLAEQQVQQLICQWWLIDGEQLKAMQPARAISRNLGEYLARHNADEPPPRWLVEAALAEC